jgi:hypothetical protein
MFALSNRLYYDSHFCHTYAISKLPAHIGVIRMRSDSFRVRLEGLSCVALMAIVVRYNFIIKNNPRASSYIADLRM